MELRPYQHELVAKVRAEYASGARSVVLQLGTGGGKTATSADLLRRAQARGRRCLFLAHLDSLIGDTHARLTEAGIHVGFVQAGRPASHDAPVQVASIATLHVRGERPPADFVIVDECQRAPSASIRDVLSAYPKAHLLGLSAAPQRGDGQATGDVFERMVCGPSNASLVRAGYLAPCEVLAPGDYRDQLAAAPVASYLAHAAGRRAIVFAADKAHAKTIVDAFSKAGVTAALLVGETSRERRDELREQLRAGTLDVLVGVAVFLEGWDCPEVEVVILARGFTVCGAYLQGIGRGRRISPRTGKTACTVIDLRGAVFLHGLPDDERIWSLTGEAVRRAEAGPALVRCSGCFAVFSAARTCPRCGKSTANEPRIKQRLTKAEKLQRFDALDPADRDARYLARLQRVAEERVRLRGGAAEQWALRRFRKQFGRDPITKEAA